MALPLLAVLPVIGRSLVVVLSRWQGLLAFVGVATTLSFSVSVFFNQATSSLLRLWPILTLGFVFLLAREFVRGWLIVKTKEASLKEK